MKGDPSSFAFIIGEIVTMWADTMKVMNDGLVKVMFEIGMEEEAHEHAEKIIKALEQAQARWTEWS